MNNENINNGLIIITLFIIIINKAISNGNFTCKNYILNIYLYLSLSLSLLTFISILLEKKVNNPNIYKKLIFISFLVGLICIIGMQFVDNIYITHLIWLLFIFQYDFPCTINKYIKREESFTKTLISVVIIVLFLTAIAFYKPEYISLSWGNILFVALIVGIVVQLIQLFIGEPSSKFNLFLSYAFVLLFSLFLLYDTKFNKLRQYIVKI